MIIKLALFLWFGAFFVSLVAKGQSRSWMARLFVAGFVLLFMALFLRIIGRMI